MVGRAFEFRFGDEWQILLARSSLAYTVYSHLYYKLLMYPFYCGIGIGPISTSSIENTHEADGPAFHLARAALNEAKEGSRPVVFRLYQTDDWGKEMQSMAQSVAGLVDRLRDGRRDSQKVASMEAILNSERPTSLAQKLGIGRTSAHRRLQSSGVEDELEAIAALERMLEWGARYLLHR
jgi:hypothetical protein